ncbi:unnamed protein product [Rotaria socialis]|uniref:DUF1232 domain-containing protein n=2 Tax=Rotaria socialis TaxID=392032 RepID=A0A818RRF4_9BILA|nr:unnamed protein product [Rotaria socialis]CAF3415279.1 unnamed protein product [Rotaria socialis]CAF3466040.1 unnamed protein product [Rotaria socialis]CAF3655418.1 unnamed protein product [Rotaria socialis]CAF4426455.1 unnamed protein product [Rotaria socialis]
MVYFLSEKVKLFVEDLKEKVRSIKLESYALAFVYQHQRTPWYAKLSILITLGYLLSPIDLIPDFIPILGYLDDLVLVPLLILLSIKLIPTDVLKECRDKAQNKLNSTWKSKKTAWWFAVLIVLFYVIVIYFTVKWLKCRWFD